MNIDTFDLNLLRAFNALIREGSTTAAGKKLGLTQSAMSRTLKRLREAFGDPLFVRTRHGMQPTDYAKLLIVPIEDALYAARTAIDLRPVFDPQTSKRSFHIVTTEIGAAFYFRELLPYLGQVAPGVGFVVKQMPREQYLEALELGLAELALGQLPAITGAFQIEHLYDLKLACLVRRQHPTIRNSITMEQFLSARHIEVTAPSGVDALVRRALGGRAARLDIALAVPSYLAVPYMLSECDMICVVPQTLCESFAEIWPVRTLPLPFKTPPIRIGQCWHSRSNKDAAHRWLRDVVTELFSEAD
jgi:DNA-binding transcriptional LysR family regulator